MFVNTVANNIANNVVYKNKGKNKEKNNKYFIAILILVGLFFLFLNIIVVPYLWNKYMRELVPSLGEARWYHFIIISFIISIIT